MNRPDIDLAPADTAADVDSKNLVGVPNLEVPRKFSMPLFSSSSNSLTVRNGNEHVAI